MNSDNIVPQSTKKSTIESFLSDIWGTMKGDLYLWTKDNREKKTETFWIETPQEGAERALHWAGKRDVYFGICSTSDHRGIIDRYYKARRERKEEKPVSMKGAARLARPEKDEIVAVPALWADIDTGEEGHSSRKNYSPSIDAWKENVFPLYPPSYLIQTGHGYHAYWILEKPFTITNEEERQRIQSIVAGFQRTIQELTGYKIDETADLNRVLRVPGTWNRKNAESPLPVSVIERNPAARYKTTDFPLYADNKKAPEPPAKEKMPEAGKSRLSPLEKCRRGRSAEKFNRIYNGDISGYPSLSEAVQALANIAVPRCDNSFPAMLELFQESPLWDMITAKHGEGERAEKWLYYSFEKAQDRKPATTPTPQEPTGGGGEKVEPAETADPETFPGIQLPDWIPNAKGEPRPITCSYKNVKCILSHAGIKIKYNTLKKKLEYMGGPSDLLRVDGISPERLENRIRTMCYKNGLNISRPDCESAINCIGDENQYNPVQDWLREARKEYEQKPGNYLEETYKRLHLKPGQNEELCWTLFRKWFISAVKMAFNTGSYGQAGILVFSGPQGCGKTRFLQTIVPFPDWAKDGESINPKQKDDVLRACGYWLCELGEIGQTLRKERKDQLKAFFTARTDDIRKPYGRTSVVMPRTTCFIGSVNEEVDNGFLNDPTGSRRFWPIVVKEIDPLPEGYPLSLLWGQVMKLAETESEYLNDDEKEALATHNLEHDKKTAEEIILLDGLDWGANESIWEYRTAKELAEEMHIRPERVNNVGRALRHIAQMDKRVKVPTNNKNRTYKVPPSITDIEQENRDFLNITPSFSVIDGSKK